MNLIAIPTRGDSWYLRELLMELDDFDIILLTKTGNKLYDKREIKREKENFSSWYNQALNYAKENNYTNLAFINDDISVDPRDMTVFFNRLGACDWVFYWRETPAPKHKHSGDFFAVKVATALTMDEENFPYHWGDLDMKYRGIEQGLKIESVNLPTLMRHRKGAQQEINKIRSIETEFAETHKTGLETFEKKWGRIY